jgi:hypothetical protein
LALGISPRIQTIRLVNILRIRRRTPIGGRESAYTQLRCLRRATSPYLGNAMQPFSAFCFYCLGHGAQEINRELG